MDDWVRVLESVEACFAPVLTLEEVYQNPHLLHREMILDVEHPVLGMLTQLGLPIKLKETPGRVALPAPELGEHNGVILKGLGYSIEEISDFRERGII